MVSKEDVAEYARKLGFADIGFTSAEPFETQKELLASRWEGYAWTAEDGFDLREGVDPRRILPGAKSIIVLIENYFQKSLPPSMEPHFGRAYQDDDRVTKDGMTLRLKTLRKYLRDREVESKAPWNLSARFAAAKAGLGYFGKNGFFFSRAARGSSWVWPVALVVDHEFAPDPPSLEVGCPEWCKNTCITSCPTGAMKGPRKMDPRKCISYLTWSESDGITPVEFREPMGLWVYGCDRCQNVCPRNEARLAQQPPLNERVVPKAEDFELSRLLHMDEEYFKTRIFPHMFYLSVKGMWQWQMNVARAMGNSLDPKYIADLIRAFRENQDERVCGMTAWALGRIGGSEARTALGNFLGNSKGLVREEILQALAR